MPSSQQQQQQQQPPAAAAAPGTAGRASSYAVTDLPAAERQQQPAPTTRSPPQPGATAAGGSAGAVGSASRDDTPGDHAAGASNNGGGTDNGTTANQTVSRTRVLADGTIVTIEEQRGAAAVGGAGTGATTASGGGGGAGAAGGAAVPGPGTPAGGGAAGAAGLGSPQGAGNSQRGAAGPFSDEFLPPNFALESDSDEDGAEELTGCAGCLHWLYRIIYAEMLEPHDSFEVVLRKMITAVAFVGSPLFAAVGIFWAVLAGNNEYPAEQPALILAAVLSFVCVIFAQIFYWHARLTHTVSNGMVSSLILGGMLWCGCLSIAVPHFPCGTCLIGLAEASVLTRSEWFLWHMLAVTALYVVATYNITFLNYGDWTLLTLPTPHQGTSGENLALAVVGWCVLVLMTGALYLQYVEYLRLVHRSSSTTQMGWRIAHHLRRWDIAAVEKTLGKYRSLPNRDNFLHTQFANIVQTIRDLSVYLPRDIIAALVTSGESLRDAELRAREVTLLWVEISNFPALCDTVPCDELAKLLRWFHEAMARVVRQHDGVIVRLGGNMLCGMWNAPQRHENAASRACLAALHCAAVAEDALVTKFEDEGFGLQIRCGVHSGTAMVGPLGSCDRASFTANGGAVHFAAAMAKFGKRMRRSSVMVSDATLREANNQLALLGRNSGGSARLVAREATEARALRHTTTTLVHQLLGLHCPSPVSATMLLRTLGHLTGPVTPAPPRTRGGAGAAAQHPIGSSASNALLLLDTSGGHGPQFTGLFASGVSGNAQLSYPACVLAELAPKRILETYMALDPVAEAMARQLDAARRSRDATVALGIYEAIQHQLLHQAPPQPGQQNQQQRIAGGVDLPDGLRRNGIDMVFLESLIAQARRRHVDSVVVFPDD